jgi:hypothetical protein
VDTFSPNDSIRVELQLHDESGVRDVSAVFFTEDNEHYVVLRGSGHGQTDAKVTLTLSGMSSSIVAPGVYQCRQLEAWDVKGNQREYTLDTYPQLADKCFRYQYPESGQPGDEEGPELVG